MKSNILIGVVVLIVFSGVVYYFRVSEPTATEVSQQYMMPQVEATRSAF